MPQPTTLPANAKLNLFLEVTGKRADGYHDLDSVFVEIDFCDTLIADPRTNNTMEIFCDDPSIPPGDANLALGAVRLLHHRLAVHRRGMVMRLHKKIPVGSGLGGGSSDAATALRIANEFWKCGLNSEQLAGIGAELGSDIPFFLHGGVCRVQGRGEQITPLEDFPRHIEFGLALPPVQSDTAQAYRDLVVPQQDRIQSADAFLDALGRGDVAAMEQAAFNRFEEPVFARLPQLAEWRNELTGRIGRPVHLSGSGSALWFFAEPGWLEKADIQNWADNAGIRLVSARAVPARRTCLNGQPWPE